MASGSNSNCIQDSVQSILDPWDYTEIYAKYSDGRARLALNLPTWHRFHLVGKLI